MTRDHDRLVRDLNAPAFREGEAKGRWRFRVLEWPHLFLTVRARDGREFWLRLDCREYPFWPPTGAFWDVTANAPLPAERWPRGDAVITSVFNWAWHQGWSLYFPFDRIALTANTRRWWTVYPHLKWKPGRGIVQHVAEVHRLLNSRGYKGAI